MSGSKDNRLQQAFTLHRAGDLAQAEKLYRGIVRSEPRNFDALYLLGVVHLQRGECGEAERLMGKALTIQPRSLDALKNRGMALKTLKRHEEALACFDKALAIEPRIADLQLVRAMVLAELNRHREAVMGFDIAVSLNPKSVEAWNNRGNALLALRQFADALKNFDRAAELAPGNALVWNNRGNALAELKRFDEAIDCYSRALTLRPGDAGILNHRGIARYEAKRYADAARDYAEVLKLEPGFDYALGNFIFSKFDLCEWTNLAAEKAELAARLSAGERVIMPMQHAALFSSNANAMRAARIWVKDKYPASSAPLWRGETYRHDRIRVAYLSADFHSHATAALMAGVFEQHNRARLEVHAVSYGRDENSDMRRRLRAAFESFHDVRDGSDRDVAEFLRQAEIDIAVDLKGHTEEARPGILAWRAAPVQAQYLGFPGTMGAEYVDYVIADRIVIPAADFPHYSEKVVWLPGSYQCNDGKRRIAEATPTRVEAGLPESGFIFCCFNASYKLAPEIFDLWMRLLKAVEGSVLWLIDDGSGAAANLKSEAVARGVDSGRLVFAGRQNLDANLARQRLADLFLDSLPYGAHTTASDALWVGLPLLTSMGESFAGRVAASLLHAVGLPELITHSLADYEAMALKLARDPAALSSLKAKLAANRDTCALFDTARFTRNLEAAYTKMWECAQRGEPPAAFAVEEAP